MDLLDLILSQFQLYGLIFLLGSFSVATLSDLRRMSAQKEFLEVWLLFWLVFLGYDIYIGYTEGADLQIYLKWGLIGLFIISWFFKILFRTAIADAMACIAVMSLLTPPFIIFLILILKIIDFLTRPFLKVGFGKKNYYPFLPAVTISTVITLFVAFRVVDWIEMYL